jgi:hypothetical protein
VRRLCIDGLDGRKAKLMRLLTRLSLLFPVASGLPHLLVFLDDVALHFCRVVVESLFEVEV